MKGQVTHDAGTGTVGDIEAKQVGREERSCWKVNVRLGVLYRLHGNKHQCLLCAVTGDHWPTTVHSLGQMSCLTHHSENIVTLEDV